MTPGKMKIKLSWFFDGMVIGFLLLSGIQSGASTASDAAIKKSLSAHATPANEHSESARELHSRFQSARNSLFFLISSPQGTEDDHLKNAAQRFMAVLIAMDQYTEQNLSSSLKIESFIHDLVDYLLQVDRLCEKAEREGVSAEPWSLIRDRILFVLEFLQDSSEDALNVSWPEIINKGLYRDFDCLEKNNLEKNDFHGDISALGVCPCIQLSEAILQGSFLYSKFESHQWLVREAVRKKENKNSKRH